MNRQDLLTSFFAKMEKDQRISKAHLAVYLALFCLWSKQEFNGLLFVYSWQILPIAKISTAGTYYMIIKQLHEYGYLRYEPSLYRKRGSLIDLESIMCNNV